MRRTTRAHLGPYFNEAARLLWRRIREREGGNQEQARRRLGLGQGTLLRYLYGDRLPELELAVRIARHYPEVAVHLWLRPSRQPFNPLAAYKPRGVLRRPVEQAS